MMRNNLKQASRDMKLVSIMLLLGCGFFVLFLTAPAKATWDNSTFDHREQLAIISPHGAINQSVVRVAITYDSGMNPDFSDLRFYQDGVKLPYYRFGYVEGDASIFDLLLTDLGANNSIYAYFGNNTMVTLENSVYASDWQGNLCAGAIDTDKFPSSDGGIWSQSGCVLNGTTDIDWATLSSSYDAKNYMVSGLFKPDFSTGYASGFILRSNGVYTGLFGGFQEDAGQRHIATSKWGVDGQLSACNYIEGDYYILEAYAAGTTFNATIYYLNGTVKCSKARFDAADESGYMRAGTRSLGSTYFKDIRVWELPSDNQMPYLASIGQIEENITYPVISINSPQNVTYHTNNIMFNFGARGGTSHNFLELFVDGNPVDDGYWSINNSYFSGFNDFPPSNATYNFTIKATDNNSISNQTDVIFTINYIEPSIPATPYGSRDYCMDDVTLIRNHISFNNTTLVNATEVYYCENGCVNNMCLFSPFNNYLLFFGSLISYGMILAGLRWLNWKAGLRFMWIIYLIVFMAVFFGFTVMYDYLMPYLPVEIQPYGMMIALVLILLGMGATMFV
jgi:hypothetical protein